MTLMDVPKGVNDIKPQSYYINKFNAKNSKFMPVVFLNKIWGSFR